MASADLDQLAKRAERDLALVRSGHDTTAQFSGRVVDGIREQSAFDLDRFQAGLTVRMDTAVVSVRPVSATFNPPSQFQERVLMIRDPAVVTDGNRTVDPCTRAGNPTGTWTFNHLITEMANQSVTGIDPAVFAEDWLKNWTVNQTINSFGVPSRMQMQSLINQWRAASGGGNLDLQQAPFRLIAIIPRIDLRGGGYGSGHGPNRNGSFGDAGEARFVFGLVLPPGWSLSGRYPSPVLNPNGCRALPFSVIFEYRVQRSACADVRDWAQRWSDLDNHVPGTSAYNDALERLTEEFVRADAVPFMPNGSSIGQVRTNEIALAPPWQLREFHLDQFPWGPLAETTTNDTADDSFNNSVDFQNWILGSIAPSLFAPWDQMISPVPATLWFPPFPDFQGAHPEAPSAGFFWNAPGLNLSPNAGDNADNWGRHRASLASCNGCHARETGTSFVHVDPSTPGLPANLSGFLTGITVADPAEASGLPHRSFSDLIRREADIQLVAGMSCVRIQPVDVSLVNTSLRSTGRIPENPFPSSHSPGDARSVPVDDLKANRISEVH